jgi:type IV secretion system protein VirB11
MSNLNIINNSLNFEVLEYFKSIFKQNITKKRFLTFNEIRDITSEELGMDLMSNNQHVLIQTWFENINNLKYLRPFIKETFEEIIIHSPELIQVFKGSLRENMKLDLSVEDIYLSIEVLALRHRQNWNQGTPFISFKCSLHGRSCRVTALHPLTHGSREGFKLFIRAVGNTVYPISNFVIETNLQEKLRQIIVSKSNVIISGSTGSGKTSLLTSLLSLINEEHIIILEDTQEINIDNDSFTYLLSSENDQYSLEKYTQYALRMRPDRIILGEMRGAEIVPFMLAMNNGHNGLMSSIHANNARDGIERLALLFEMNIKNKTLTFSEVLKLISNNVNYAIHMKEKKVVEVIKILGSDGERVNFEYIYSENRYACSEYRAA